MLTDGELPSTYLFHSAWKESRAGFTYSLVGLSLGPQDPRGLQLTVVRI